MVKKIILIVLAFWAFALIAPFGVLAITNSEIIAILKEAFAEVTQLTRDAYCAAGVTKFCP